MQEKIVDIHIRVSENEKKKLHQKAKKVNYLYQII